jgi:DNA-binding response OmpR family regulator
MRIMVIDDDEDILNLFKEFLKKEGYDVEAYFNPLVAIRNIEENPSKYSLIITDIRMPGMTGIELTKRVCAINADIKIVLMSAFEINGDELKELSYHENIKKPIHMQELARTIAAILNR